MRRRYDPSSEFVCTGISIWELRGLPKPKQVQGLAFLMDERVNELRSFRDCEIMLEGRLYTARHGEMGNRVSD